jgi:hypothetical protein
MSKLTFLEVPIAETGMTLILLSNGWLMIERAFNFMPLFDYSKEGISGNFDAQSFSLTLPGEGFEVWQEYDYGTAYPYKEIPALKQWLIQQNLQFPQYQ